MHQTNIPITSAILSPFYIIDDYYFRGENVRLDGEFLVLEINKRPDFDIITSLN